MKLQTIFLTAFLSITITGFCQIGPIGHLTIFSEDGDRFSLILNGELINDIPQTNLRVEDLNQPYYSAKIKFEDNSLLDISKKSIMIADTDGTFADVTYKIKRDRNKKGKMRINFFSQVPVDPGFIPAPNIHVIHYGQPRPVLVQQSGGVIQSQTTTIQNNNNVNLGVNIGGVSMGVSINDPDGGLVTQTTTTSSSTISSGGHIDHGVNEIHSTQPIRGCDRRSCMSPRDFSDALIAVKAQNFEKSMLKTANQVVSNNCLNVDQIIQIANVFNFEDNKLEFAKFAYDFCVEKRNYFKLNSIFNFSNNADALSDYVRSRN